MKIGIVQFSPAWENVEESIITIEEIISKTTNVKEIDLLVFPEMSLTGFTMNSKNFAEELDGTGTTYFIKLAQRLKTNIIAGIIEKDDDKIYNSLVHFDRNGLVCARYRKIHPFTFAKEDKFFSTGKETIITKIDKHLFGLSICYDLRFPELYRLYAKENVDALINIANWPVPRIEHWKHLNRARAIDNLCFMVSANRTGEDPYNKYNGNSSVIDPMGEVVTISDEENCIIICDVDLDKTKEIRKELPFIEDIKLL